MSEQINMFRSTDPPSSKEAARKMEVSGKRARQMEQVLMLLQLWPIGISSMGLAIKTNSDRSMIARRLPDLEKDGRARSERAGKCPVTGESAKLWWPIKEATSGN